MKIQFKWTTLIEFVKHFRTFIITFLNLLLSYGGFDEKFIENDQSFQTMKIINKVGYEYTKINR